MLNILSLSLHTIIINFSRDTGKFVLNMGNIVVVAESSINHWNLSVRHCLFPIIYIQVLASFLLSVVKRN